MEMSEVLSEFLKIEISRPVEPTRLMLCPKLDTETTRGQSHQQHKGTMKHYNRMNWTM